MAVIENIIINGMAPIITDGIEWSLSKKERELIMPHVFFKDGEPWIEANNYALTNIQNMVWGSIKTAMSNMNHLKAYASWLEENNTHWQYFPIIEKERCIHRFRGYLIEQRDSGKLAPSTAKHRMLAVLNFYKWIESKKIIKSGLWKEAKQTVKFVDDVGFKRSITVSYSDLAIKNRRRIGCSLEDGLSPITSEMRELLLKILYENDKEELYLMHKIAFFTGARSETIRTLQLESLENTISVGKDDGIKCVRVGPPTKVKTKYGVSGLILFPATLLHELIEYSYSTRRLERQLKSKNKKSSTLFITRSGNPYSDTSFTKEISDMRVFLSGKGHNQFLSFKFHQARATYGTMLMSFALEIFPFTSNAIGFVRNAMLHKHESTTWRYVKFIEYESFKEKLSDEFFRLFTASTSYEKEIIAKVTYAELE
ncbi:hypothetical protein ACU615_21500 [Klebsiella aerogenes]